MAYEMKHEGYDSVIAYNWVAVSNDPGSAIKQSPRLALRDSSCRQQVPGFCSG